MNKYRITNPNNKEVRDCKSRTTKQTSSSMSKALERAAFVRGDMFSGNTMLNNGNFNMNPNLDSENYSLPNSINYNNMPKGDEYNINQYNNTYNKGNYKFIMNKK